MRHIRLKILNKRSSWGGGGVEIVSNARETPIHATTCKGINDILSGGNEVDDDGLPNTKTKPSHTGDTGLPVY